MRKYGGEDEGESLAVAARQLNKATVEWLGAVSVAAQAFEARWTLLALRRVDAALAKRLHEQRELFVEAYVTGDVADIVEQGAAMCRGYVIAAAALEQAGAPDDAYQLGQCPNTGTMVAIGEQKAAVNRVREVYGENVIWVTPDEIAMLFATIEALKSIGTVKRKFSGSEILGSQQHSR